MLMISKGPDMIGSMEWAVYCMDSSRAWKELRRFNLSCGSGFRDILRPLLDGNSPAERHTVSVLKFFLRLLQSGKPSEIAELRAFGPERFFILDIHNVVDPDSATFAEVFLGWHEIVLAGGVLAVVVSAKFVELVKVAGLDKPVRTSGAIFSHHCFTTMDEAISFLERCDSDCRK